MGDREAGAALLNAASTRPGAHMLRVGWANLCCKLSIMTRTCNISRALRQSHAGLSNASHVIISCWPHYNFQSRVRHLEVYETQVGQYKHSLGTPHFSHNTHSSNIFYQTAALVFSIMHCLPNARHSLYVQFSFLLCFR